MAWGVYDYPEPKEAERVCRCPYCGRELEGRVFKLDEQWACEDCFEKELDLYYTLTDIAEAMGYEWAKAEEVYA